MDIATIIGIVLALGSIIGGQVLEGGHLGSIMQLTAFIIVMGGTIGAVCVQNPLSVVLKGVSLLRIGIMDPKHDNKGTIATIIDLKDHQRALVWIDDRFETALKPGLHAYWTIFHTVKVVVLDGHDTCFQRNDAGVRERQVIMGSKRVENRILKFL